MSYPSSRVPVYDHLSLVSLRLRGTRSRNKRACLLRFEKGDLSYLSLRRTPVVGTLAPASSGRRSTPRSTIRKIWMVHPGTCEHNHGNIGVCGHNLPSVAGSQKKAPSQIAYNRWSRLSSKVYTSARGEVG